MQFTGKNFGFLIVNNAKPALIVLLPMYKPFRRLVAPYFFINTVKARNREILLNGTF